jgi:hypothetical protein
MRSPLPSRVSHDDIRIGQMARRLQGRQGRDLNLAEWNSLTYDPRKSLIMVGAIGAGAITYTMNGARKVAVAAGFAVPAWPTKIRGAAYLDGMMFQGTQDGQVFAYDFNTGKRLWTTTIADVKVGEKVSAAPIAWNGLVFIGNAGGDYKGGKRRMYALDAKSGKVVWQFFMTPRQEGDPVFGPVGASPDVGSTWKNLPVSPSRAGDFGRPSPSIMRRGCCMSPAATRLRTLFPLSARAITSFPARSSFSTPRPETTNITGSLCRGIGTTGMCRILPS